MNCPSVGLIIEKKLLLFYLLHEKFDKHLITNTQTIMIDI